MLVVTDDGERPSFARLEPETRGPDLGAVETGGLDELLGPLGGQQDELVRDLDGRIIEAGLGFEFQGLVTLAFELARVGEETLVDPVGDRRF